MKKILLGLLFLASLPVFSSSNHSQCSNNKTPAKAQYEMITDMVMNNVPGANITGSRQGPTYASYSNNEFTIECSNYEEEYDCEYREN